MNLLPLTACFLAGLAGPGLAQVPKPKPRPRPPDPEREREKLQSLVQLPEDFVRYARVPEGGLQPRLGIGKQDLALIYFKGDEAGGDLYLTRTNDDAKTFAASVRLNPTPGAVAAWDGVQTGSVDVGPDGRAHVAWISGGETPSLHYVREAPATGLEPVQDLGSPPGLCSTTAVTIDAEGLVYLFYVALGPAPDDAGVPWYHVWMRRCVDGVSFTEPVSINRDKDSVSERSALAAHVDEIMGTVFVLYRAYLPSLTDDSSRARCMRLLSSENRGQGFASSLVDNLRQKRDPRSSASLSQEKDTTIAAWDGDGSVFWAPIRRALNKVNLAAQPKDEGEALRRWQAAAASSGEEIILTWLEQPKEDRNAPPMVGWQVWLRDGRYAVGRGRAPESAGVTSPAVFARAERGFTILY